MNFECAVLEVLVDVDTCFVAASQLVSATSECTLLASGKHLQTALGCRLLW